MKEAIDGTVKTRQVPSCSRMVHYVMPKLAHLRPHIEGEHRPAIVIKVWGDHPTSAVNLAVLLDGTGDKEDFAGQYLHVGSVAHDPTGQTPNTWHWPEYVAPVPVETSNE